MDTKPDPASTEIVRVDLALKPAFTAKHQELGDVLGFTKEQRTTLEKEFTQTIRASGLDPNTFGQKLYELTVDDSIADVHGRGGDAAALALDNQKHSEETRQQLRATYGEEEAEALLSRAAAFVKTQPALAELLNRGSFGSRADLIIPIVEHVRRVNYRPAKGT
jgi:hypothetical protein